MDLKNLLKSMPLPAIYKRDGKECYFDTYRKKLIEITPEETVRQKIAKLFEIKYGVPEEMISLEVPMSYYAAGVSGRADIVIHAYDTKTQCCYPVTVIECKNESFPAAGYGECWRRLNCACWLEDKVSTRGCDRRLAY